MSSIKLFHLFRYKSWVHLRYSFHLNFLKYETISIIKSFSLRSFHIFPNFSFSIKTNGTSEWITLQVRFWRQELKFILTPRIYSLIDYGKFFEPASTNGLSMGHFRLRMKSWNDSKQNTLYLKLFGHSSIEIKTYWFQVTQININISIQDSISNF
jgi:hypothetical protein